MGTVVSLILTGVVLSLLPLPVGPILAAIILIICASISNYANKSGIEAYRKQQEAFAKKHQNKQ
jgi:hypothetical protein